MNNEQLNTILTWIVSFLSSATGVAFLGFIAKLILNFRGKKYAKLTDADEDRIAEKSSKRVIASIKDGVSIDADAMVNKATNKRLDTVESKFNDIVVANNEQMQILTKLAQVVLELKSPSLASREELANALGKSIPKLNSIAIVEQPKLVAHEADETELPTAPTKVEKEETAKIMY